MLRPLLAGTAPERFHALTYTTAAAAEMSNRVFDRLAAWVTVSDFELADTLAIVLQRPANPEEMSRARQLFARAIETPGGLKVQTIHAFCERLLQRFPLEAGVPPNFVILDDATTNDILQASRDEILLEAARSPDSGLGVALRRVIEHAADETFDAVLKEALANKSWLRALANYPPSISGDDETRHLYTRILDLPPDADAGALQAKIANVLNDEDLRRASAVLREGSKTDRQLADKLIAVARCQSTSERADHIAGALLTKEGEARSDRFVTKAVRAAAPDIVAALERARDACVELSKQRLAAIAIDATLALALISDAVLTSFDREKARRAALDFDDLIKKAAYLLRDKDDESAVSQTAWVLFKLDGGIEHVLVDEAQDTSPEQWAVVRALAAEFFAGEAVHDVQRTLFAVGDEKQSIYGFQGAAPEMFAATGKSFSRLAHDAGQNWEEVPLTVSFRSTAPILAAVDRVFDDHAAMPGLGSPDQEIRHHAVRIGQAGLVELWQPEPYEKPAEVDAFAPNQEGSRASPSRRLATRIAKTIRRWLDGGEMLESEGRPVRPSDILVLVRRRRPFAPQMVAALKDLRIPVAGADRLRLIDEIAVKDLMVLGDFLTLPEDDLALATVLKSPLFGLDDAALEALAPKRKGLLWSALLQRAEGDALYAEPARILKDWRSEADYRPPYEFFSRLLDGNGGEMRRRMLARLGLEAADPLDEFLNQALNYDSAHPASLQGFLVTLRDADPELKRDMEQGRDEVRVMTVHGSKGLEAPIVFLPDTFGRAGVAAGNLLVDLAVSRPADDENQLLIWPVAKASRVDAVKASKQAATASEQEELNRLLYVAMTRPRDRLYVCGYESARTASPRCWYRQIEHALLPIAERVTDANGTLVWRITAPQTAPPRPSKAAVSGPMTSEPVPAWALAPPPAETIRAIPLAPSQLAPLETDESGEPVERTNDTTWREPPPLPPIDTGDGTRFLRGTLTHALLQYLPSLPPDAWPAAAEAFLASRGDALPPRTRDGIVKETLAILLHPQFGELFGPNSKAEVPIVAMLEPAGGGTPYRLSGQIDRLAETAAAVWLIDYKTNRPSPRKTDDVPEAYRLQLAAYRLALERIFQNKPVRAAIIWTDGPRWMEIPPHDLDEALINLWHHTPTAS